MLSSILSFFKKKKSPEPQSIPFNISDHHNVWNKYVIACARYDRKQASLLEVQAARSDVQNYINSVLAEHSLNSASL